MTAASLRPTLRAAFCFALSVPVALLLLALWRDTWQVCLYLPSTVLTLILADAALALQNRRLALTVTPPARLAVGQAGKVRCRLRAEGRTPPVRLELLLEQAGEADPPRLTQATLAEGRLDCDLPLVPRRRGQLTVKALWLRWWGPLRLVEFRRREPVEKRIDVLPDIHGIHDAALRFFDRNAVYGSKAQRLKGEGTEFETLCEYTQGMDNRFIDWKRSARHRKLLCKEFRQERNHQIVLGFDTGHLMLEPIDGVPKLDHAIKAGLLLGLISLHNGDLLGGCGFDARFRSFLKPGRGMPYFRQFQRFSAGLDYRTEETNHTLGLAELHSRLQRRALIVLFTEFVDSISAELLMESLQLLLRRHVVVFVTLRDPLLTRLRDAPPGSFSAAAKAVIAGDFLRERSIVLERAARLGVHCLDVPARHVSAALINRYLLIKQRGLL